MKDKRVSHMRVVLETLENKGYTVLSLRWNGCNLEAVIDHPYSAGNKAFLEKALDGEEAEPSKGETA